MDCSSSRTAPARCPKSHSCQKTCCCAGSPQFPSGRIRLLWRGVLHGLQCGYLLWHCRGNLFSGTCSTSSLFFFSDLGVCRTVSFTCSHSSFKAAVQCFLPFFEYISPETHQLCHWWPQLWPVLGLSEPALHGCVQHSTAPCPFSERSPCSTSCYSNRDTCTQSRLEAR